MSADNAILIIETEGPEYRVKYLLGMDNIYWDDEKKQISSDIEVMLKNAREMFEGCDVIDTYEGAVQEAVRINEEFLDSDDFGYIEHGVVQISMPGKF